MSSTARATGAFLRLMERLSLVRLREAWIRSRTKLRMESSWLGSKYFRENVPNREVLS